MTPEELQDIAYAAHNLFGPMYNNHQKVGEKYLYQYLNRKQPVVTFNTTICLRNKIILRFGYPCVVSRYPNWR